MNMYLIKFILRFVVYVYLATWIVFVLANNINVYNIVATLLFFLVDVGRFIGDFRKSKSEETDSK